MEKANNILDDFLVRYHGFLECSTLRDDMTRVLAEYNNVIEAKKMKNEIECTCDRCGKTFSTKYPTQHNVCDECMTEDIHASTDSGN